MNIRKFCLVCCAVSIKSKIFHALMRVLVGGFVPWIISQAIDKIDKYQIYRLRIPTHIPFHSIPKHKPILRTIFSLLHTTNIHRTPSSSTDSSAFCLQTIHLTELLHLSKCHSISNFKTIDDFRICAKFCTTFLQIIRQIRNIIGWNRFKM